MHYSFNPYFYRSFLMRSQLSFFHIINKHVATNTCLFKLLQPLLILQLIRRPKKKYLFHSLIWSPSLVYPSRHISCILHQHFFFCQVAPTFLFMWNEQSKLTVSGNTISMTIMKARSLSVSITWRIKPSFINMSFILSYTNQKFLLDICT